MANSSTPLYDEYLDRHINQPTDPAKKIFFAVIGDLTDRMGFDNAWDDTDSGIREELLQTNLAKIKKNLL